MTNNDHQILNQNLFVVEGYHSPIMAFSGTFYSAGLGSKLGHFLCVSVPSNRLWLYIDQLRADVVKKKKKT